MTDLAVKEPEQVLVPARPRRNAMNQLGVITTFMLNSIADQRANGEFALVHIVKDSNGDKGDPLLSRIVDIKAKDAVKRERTLEVAQELYDYALQNIECYSLQQIYRVVAYEKGREKVLGGLDFPLTPPPSVMLGGLSQPASETGVLAQSMHFSEIAFGLTIQTARQENERLVRLLEAAQAQIDVLQKRDMERIGLMEEMLSRRMERELLKDAHDQRMAREGKLWNAVETMGMAVMKQRGIAVPFARSKKGASAMTMIKNLVSSLTPEQISTITGCLSEDQQGEFAEILSTVGGT